MRQAFHGCSTLLVMGFRRRTASRPRMGMCYRTRSLGYVGWGVGRSIHASPDPDTRPHVATRSTVRPAGADERYTSSTRGWPQRREATMMASGWRVLS